MRRLLAAAGVAAVAGLLLFWHTPADRRPWRSEEANLKQHNYWYEITDTRDAHSPSETCSGR